MTPAFITAETEAEFAAALETSRRDRPGSRPKSRSGSGWTITARTRPKLRTVQGRPWIEAISEF